MLGTTVVPPTPLSEDDAQGRRIIAPTENRKTLMPCVSVVA